MTNLIEKLKWRYAAKKMDAAKAVPQEKVERILEAIRLTATSSGLQPYEVIVVTDPAVRAQIQPHAWNQAQITDGSHLLVFAAAEEQVDATPMEGFDPAKIDEILGLRERGLRSVVLMPLGYRAAEGDWLVNLKKVRRERADFITEV